MTIRRKHSLQNVNGIDRGVMESVTWLLAINLLALSPAMPADRRAALQARAAMLDAIVAGASPHLN